LLRVLILRVWCRIGWAAWLSGIGLALGPVYGCPVDRTSKTGQSGCSGMGDTGIVRAQGTFCVMAAKAPSMNLVRPTLDVP
jgi:hypothetical protein